MANDGCSSISRSSVTATRACVPIADDQYRIIHSVPPSSLAMTSSSTTTSTTTTPSTSTTFAATKAAC